MLEKAQKIYKEHQWEILVASIIVVVAFLSYGLGYLSASQSVRAPIIIEKNS